MALEQYQGDVAMCCRCSACKFVPMQKVKGSGHSYVCPSISRYNFHAYSGGGRMNIANQALKSGTVNYTDKMMDIINNCQICGACGVSCNYAMDMEVTEPIQEFRIKAVKEGHTLPVLDKIIERMKKHNTMVPGTPAKRADWAKGLNLKDVTREKVDVMYHPGCLSSFDKDSWKVAQATARLLQKAGVNFGIAGVNDVCCGGRAYQMGYEPEFKEQAQKAMDIIKQSGARTVVTSCADCYQAYKVLYDKFGLRGDLEVLHTSEYFDRLIKEGKLKPSKRVNMAVTYHDPCRLGRLGEPWIHWEGKKVPGDRFVFDPPKTYRRGTEGVYEPPREVLKSIPGVKLSEMDRIKEYGWCCGAGGGVNESNPEFAQWTASERLDEATSTGAEALVTACPWCEQTLNEAAEKGEKRLKVYDVAELLEKSV